VIVLGCDPGLSGGLAVIEAGPSQRFIGAIPVPTNGEKAKRRVDVVQMVGFLYTMKPTHAVIERAQAMPEQGSSSGFIYGRAVGALEATILGMQIPLTIIEPTAWKKAHGLIKRGKEDSRQRALQLFPGRPEFARKMDHNVAEASLIAWYGIMLLRGNNNAPNR